MNNFMNYNTNSISIYLILLISIIFLKCDMQDLGACVDPKEEEDAQSMVVGGFKHWLVEIL